jgi:hypothetical protein
MSLWGVAGNRRLRQETQWQICPARGGVAVYRTWPQRHPPSLTFSLLIDGFSQDVARTARNSLPDYSRTS